MSYRKAIKLKKRAIWNVLFGNYLCTQWFHEFFFCIFPVYVFCYQGTLILNPFSQIAFQNPQIITNTKKRTWSTKAKTIPLPGPQKTMYLHRLSSKTQTARKNLSLYYSHSNTSHPPKNNNEQRFFSWNF